MKGYIHSIETFGALDGPGIRTVVFFQGCPLRCKFCHTIDTTIPKRGKIYSIEELVEKVMKNKEYWGPDSQGIPSGEDCKGCRQCAECRGGVTISGGDPTFQPEFLLEFLRALRENQVHTAIDTSLYTSQKVIDSIFSFTDYWMVSLKHMDNEKHKWLTGVENTRIQENLKYLDKKLNSKKVLRIRFVVIPGITDDEEHIRKIGEFLKDFTSLDVVELLPYGEHGKFRWIELFGKYELEGRTREAKTNDVEEVAKILKEYGIETKY